MRALVISGQNHVFSFEPELTVGRMVCPVSIFTSLCLARRVYRVIPSPFLSYSDQKKEQALIMAERIGLVNVAFWYVS